MRKRIIMIIIILLLLVGGTFGISALIENKKDIQIKVEPEIPVIPEPEVELTEEEKLVLFKEQLKDSNVLPLEKEIKNLIDKDNKKTRMLKQTNYNTEMIVVALSDIYGMGDNEFSEDYKDYHHLFSDGGVLFDGSYANVSQYYLMILEQLKLVKELNVWVEIVDDQLESKLISYFGMEESDLQKHIRISQKDQTVIYELFNKSHSSESFEHHAIRITNQEVRYERNFSYISSYSEISHKYIYQHVMGTKSFRINSVGNDPMYAGMFPTHSKQISLDIINDKFTFQELTYQSQNEYSTVMYMNQTDSEKESFAIHYYPEVNDYYMNYSLHYSNGTAYDTSNQASFSNSSGVDSYYINLPMYLFENIEHLELENSGNFKKGNLYFRDATTNAVKKLEQSIVAYTSSGLTHAYVESATGTWEELMILSANFEAQGLKLSDIGKSAFREIDKTKVLKKVAEITKVMTGQENNLDLSSFELVRVYIEKIEIDTSHAREYFNEQDLNTISIMEQLQNA